MGQDRADLKRIFTLQGLHDPGGGTIREVLKYEGCALRQFSRRNSLLRGSLPYPDTCKSVFVII